MKSNSENHFEKKKTVDLKTLGEGFTLTDKPEVFISPCSKLTEEVTLI